MHFWVGIFLIKTNFSKTTFAWPSWPGKCIFYCILKPHVSMHLKSSISCSLHRYLLSTLNELLYDIVFAPMFTMQKVFNCYSKFAFLQHKLKLCFFGYFSRGLNSQTECKEELKNKKNGLKNDIWLKKSCLKCPEKIKPFFLNKLIFKISQQTLKHI